MCISIHILFFYFHIRILYISCSIDEYFKTSMDLEDEKLVKSLLELIHTRGGKLTMVHLDLTTNKNWRKNLNKRSQGVNSKQKTLSIVINC